MSMVDSEPVFASRCERVGLPETVVKKLKSLGWDTYATFAFCIQNQTDEKAFADRVLRPVLGDDQTHAARLRRIFMEAYTMTAADLKRLTDASEHDAPRKLPAQELAARLEALQSKIKPLLIRDRSEPSHALINAAAQMLEDNRVRYISWTTCTTRGQEINAVRELTSMKVWQPDKSGMIREVDKGPSMQAVVGSELEVQQALRRRGIAYAIAQVMSFSVHEELIALLFNEYQKDPLDGYEKVSLAQVAQADREIHVRLGELTRAGLAPGVGTLPLDKPMAEVLGQASVMWLLMPRAKSTKPSDEESEVPPPPPPHPEAGKRVKRVAMPRALIGGVAEDDSGNVLCFGFNLGTCQVRGDKCPKGLRDQRAPKSDILLLITASSCIQLRSWRFGAVAMFTILASDFHVDINNEPGCPNWICPVSDFLEGSILVEQNGGTEEFFARGRRRWGTLLGVAKGPVLLDAQQLHKVLPWKGGQRTVIVAFMPRQLTDLNVEQVANMQQLGFRLSSADVHEATAAPARMPHGVPCGGIPYVLELFCGTAGVAAAFQKRGCDVLGVDHVLKPRAVKAPAVRLDLTNHEHQAMILREIARAQVVFLALPCGTSSMARAIPITSRHGPKPSPLRSHAFPDGLPGLQGINAQRVQAANVLYAFTVQVFKRCQELGCVCIIENPTGSLMWETSWFRTIAQAGVWCNHQACSYGPMVSGPFATAAEAEYLPAFCAAAVARDVCDLLQGAGWSLEKPGAPGARAAQAAQKQSRRDAPSVGPSEYLSRVEVTANGDFKFPAEVGAQADQCLAGIPIGSKLLLQVRAIKKRGRASAGSYIFDVPGALDDSNMQAMANVLTAGVQGTIEHRERTLKHYERRAKELEVAEKNLKEGMNSEVRKVMDSKKIALFQEMLADAGIADPHLIKDFVEGFRITGELQPSGMFQKRLKPASLSHDDLKTTAKWAKHTVASSCRRAAKDDKVSAAVWDEALEQADKGWLRGPFTWSEVDAKYQGTWIGSKRFGIVQNEKIRAIDDLSEFLVNSSVTETEKITLEGVDQIVATARFFSCAAKDGEDRFRLPAENGGHPHDAWATILAVYDPNEDEVKFFEAVALPFGAVSSVTGFNHAARALKLILSRLLWLVNTSYYDDFTQLDFEALAESSETTAERIMDLLGWEISNGEKLHRMRRASTSWESPLILVSPTRADKNTLQNSLASFKGRLLFATNHVYGRCAQMCTQPIGVAQRLGLSERRTESILTASQEALHMLEVSGPRVISKLGDAPPVVIFSDGACEEHGSVTTHGAVLFDPLTGRQEFFGDNVPDNLVKLWQRSGKKQLVSYAEILPVVVAKATWRHILEGRSCIYFIDNEAARACFVRCFTPVLDATSLLLDSAFLDMQSKTLSWYCRVPSKSNIADDASRLEFGRCENLFVRVQLSNLITRASHVQKGVDGGVMQKLPEAATSLKSVGKDRLRKLVDDGGFVAPQGLGGRCMVSRTELEQFSRYIQCSLLSLVRGASTEARKDVDSRDETLEALTALHERADLLLENQFRLQTQFLILQQRITRLEGAVAPARAKAANDQGGVGEFTFPPSPPLGVSDLAGDAPLPQVFPGCGESSAGSFSRVSFGSECVENDLHFPPLEFPEDWEDDAPETATARTPMDSESVERSNREVASLMRDIFGSDDSHVENVESRTASASAAPCEQAASSIPDLDQAMSIAHADASADISLAASGEFVSTAGVVDDALGSFVGGLVKQDVARFGRLDDGLKLPWESEFSKLLFDPDCVWDPLQGRKQDSIFPPITHNAQAAHRPPAGPKEAPSGSIFAWAIALGAAARDPAAERERKREQGIGMWSRLVLRYSECCSLYECVSQGLSGREAGYEDVLVAVSAAVGVKSPHTIHKRAASFWTFVRWLDVHEPLAPSRLHEVQVWNFVQFLKETSAPASKAASVLSAVRFAHFVLGFRLSGIVDSKRIAGATEQQLVNVRKLRQAKDLTVSQVLELHARLESGALHCFDRALLASLLIRLYARARPSDFLFVESVEVDCPPGADYPLLVFEVSQHKGARKVQLKTKLLPILVPMIGVHGKCWIDEALTAFRNAGRSLTSVRGPLTLAPADESGVVSSRRSIASAEVGKMLRAFLGLPEEVTDPSAPRVTAYSLRGTCLGWGGKFGFDEDLKSILGRHASSVKTTQAIYSRELSAAPVRRLQDMIREVASGNFFPDNSRSSYFPRRAASDGAFPSKGAEKPNPVKVEVVSSDDSEAGNSASSDKECSDSSQSSQSSSSSSASEAVQPAVRRWKRAKVEVPDQVGLSRESLRALADHGIDTLSKLAYSCGQPGTPLPQSEFDDFISTVMPAALLGEKGSVKRLLFESQALLLNDLREQVTQPDKWSTRDVPTVERQKRMEAVRASIPGVVLEGSLEPSHGLLNAACRMEREGQLRYIAPEQCGTRMYEIQNVKAQSKVLSLEEGKLAISEEKGLPEVACGSALLLQEALKRRGVALQFAGVASYVARERYVLKLFGHMGREPPPGYARTSVHQLLTADRQVWTRMIENEISPKRSADGTYPVDRALLPTLETFDVTVALLPRKSEESKKRVAAPHKPGVERDPKIAKPPKGKGKGKKGTWQPSVPEAIRKLGGVAETPDKKRICFSRNLPCGCTQDPCPKGLHVCALCFAPDHGLQECPKRKK
ncbi:unnamed protein product [Symbiodinium sp. CCMP2592]|nr:unnamed protein product [Symbiodinium sp. CCMP2592]